MCLPPFGHSGSVGFFGLDGYRRGQDPPSVRPPHSFGADAVHVRRAGARIGRLNASVPLVTITFDADWLRVEGVPTYDVWIERGRVTVVRKVGRWWFSSGLMFDSTDGAYDGVIVWLWRTKRAEAVCMLAERGWPSVGLAGTTG